MGCGEPTDGPEGDVIEVSEDIESDVTWEAENIYLVTNELDVEARVTIEPGTRVEFEADAGLVFESSGILVADGTGEEQIVFTGTEESPGWWNGLVFEGSDHVDNVIDNAVVEYAGGDANVELTDDAAIGLTNTTLRHSGDFGLYVGIDADFFDFGSNTVTENQDAPVRAGATHLHRFDAESTYAGNDVDAVTLGVGASGAERAIEDGEDRLWQNLDVPYRFSNDVSVRDSFLTIESGTELQFEDGIQMELRDDGAIEAVGTDEPIVFTGTEESPGWWEGLLFRSADHTDNRLENTVVEYGADGQDANVEVVDGSVVSIVDSTIHHGDGHGLFIDLDSGLVEFSSNEITDNTDSPVHGGPIHLHQLDADTTYTGNGDDVVRAGITGPSVSAHGIEGDSRTWENLDVPYRITTMTNVDELLLTIEEGTKLEFAADAGLRFDDGGGMEAVGTDSEPIVFTGTEESSGWWDGVIFRESSRDDNAIIDAVVEYGGGAADGSAEASNIAVGSRTSTATVEVSDSEIRGSAEWGVWVQEDSQANSDICSANEFSDNPGGNCTTGG